MYFSVSLRHFELFLPLETLSSSHWGCWVCCSEISWFDFLKFRQSLDLELWQCKQVSTVHWKILFPKRQRLFFSPENTPANQISFFKKVRPIFWILWFSLSISMYEADVSKYVMCHSMCDLDIGRNILVFNELTCL